jgi:hypothetical protein
MSAHDEAELRAAAAATFQLDKPALLASVLTLTQQCRASAEARRIINSKNLQELEPLPTPAATVFDTINDLSWVGLEIATTEPAYAERTGGQMAHGLAYAAAKIFALAAQQNIDLGAVLAAQLVSAATEPEPF